MNILLRILQVLLAVWNIIGGAYTAVNYEQLKSAWANDLPKPVWLAIATLQVLFALGLIVPGIFGVFTKITPIAAAYLALNSLLGCILFSKYAGFPGVLWGVIPSVLAAFLAYERFS